MINLHIVQKSKVQSLLFKFPSANSESSSPKQDTNSKLSYLLLNIMSAFKEV